MLKIMSYPKIKIINPLLAQSISAFGVLFLPPIAPFIVTEFSISGLLTGLTLSSFYFGAIVSSFLTGSIVSYLGVRKSIVISLLILGVFIILASLTQSLTLMLLLFIMAGTGYSLINPAINQLITQDFSREVRGLAMSIKQTGVTLGGAIAASLLPFLTAVFDWRSSVFITGLIIIGISFYFLFILRSYEAPKLANHFSPGQMWGGINVIFHNLDLMRLSMVSFFLVGAQFSFFMYFVLYLNNDVGYSVAFASTLLAFPKVQAPLDEWFGGC
ncbi:MFS family permease [Caldalkalibacillus uzonensis]|uniref:MFS family permease n=1 Tax=Caldalkalibacillus uzonensis TaxID=353224 RepID=A0ABU0CWM7_9BACI|nr:MFS transporter [Caldalkalibacillus uzonensis]MDQ0340828.1 MFS family permease [Caldalkalibacillus uzonensis]